MFAASLKAHASVEQQRVPLMTASDVLLVAGTHGNEVNAPWLLDEWQRTPELIDAHGLTVQPLIGNPDARAANRRYIDRDLNRSFLPECFASDEGEAWSFHAPKPCCSGMALMAVIPARWPRSAQHHSGHGQLPGGLRPSAA